MILLETRENAHGINIVLWENVFALDHPSLYIYDTARCNLLALYIYKNDLVPRVHGNTGGKP